jgi:hypothetical protein
MRTETQKKVNLDLTQIDGNAFFLMGAFQRQAKKEDWTQDEINEVLTECKSGNYAHLVATLCAVCEPENED